MGTCGLVIQSRSSKSRAVESADSRLTKTMLILSPKICFNWFIFGKEAIQLLQEWLQKSSTVNLYLLGSITPDAFQTESGNLSPILSFWLHTLNVRSVKTTKIKNLFMVPWILLKKYIP